MGFLKSKYKIFKLLISLLLKKIWYFISMKSHDKLDILHDLLGSYVDVELNNFSLATKLLAQGIKLEGVQPLTKSPKLLALFASSYNLQPRDLQYHPSYSVSFYGANSLHQVRKPEVMFFHDDLWEVSITAPEELKITSYFTGLYLLGTLKQGLGGIIPKMIKDRTGKSINDSDFKDVTFNLTAKLSLDHQHYGTTTRGQLATQIKFYGTESEVLKVLQPEKLFSGVLRYLPLNSNQKRDPRKFDLLKERLKLWGTNLPFNLQNVSQEQMIQFINNLPAIDFGIKDILVLKQIASQFATTISNEVLLTGEVGGNIVTQRQLMNFNNSLKSAIIS